MKLTIFTFLFLFLLGGCQTNNKMKSGVIINRYINGQILCKVPYYLTEQLDTVVQGTVVYYYPNGVIEDSFFVIQDKKEGYYFRLDSTGTLKSRLNYNDDKLDGYSFLYYPSGVVEVAEFYENDSLISNKDFFSNGKVRSYFIFENQKVTCYSYIFDSITNTFEEAGDSLWCKAISISRIKN